MKRQFELEIENLKVALIKMGSAVEQNVENAVLAFLERNGDAAKKVIESDNQIDAMELKNDNAIIDILALRQPVASDLRFIIAVQKINNDLERISDHAVNIAQSALTFIEHHELELPEELVKMTEISKAMLKQAMDCFIWIDASVAREVLKTDNLIDDLNRQVNKHVIELIESNIKGIQCGLDLIRVSRNLERIADLSTNIAEEVVFYSQARVVKHHADEKNSEQQTEN
jgi:phosphate transport system protein